MQWQPEPEITPELWQPEMEPPVRLEDYPQTHEGDVDFVRDVFKSMGGRVVPPARPGKTKTLYMNVQRYSFLMDFENSCLTEHWDSSVKPHPRGNKRYEDPEWAAMIQSHVYPHHSDLDWYEYVDWVSQGGGDDWFEEEDECSIDHLFCKKHDSGPLDVWYDCDACIEEVRDGPMPQDGRYELVYK